MSEHQGSNLARPVGLFSLTAIALNGVVGAAIFVLPTTVARILGTASPLAYLIAWLATTLVGLCFAELGSLFESTGGPYIYAKKAFGNFIGFEVGWMFLFARLTAVAFVCSGFTAYLGYFWPQVSSGPGRVIVITLVIVVFAATNLRGVRYGAWLVNVLTVGKLLPLLVFIFVGLFFVDGRSYSLFAFPEVGSLGKASLVLIFAFGGFEFASVPSGEVINPRRNTPISMLTAITLAAVIYVLVQIVALSTLPGLSSAGAPLASAAQRFLGPMGGAVLALGAILSAAGTSSAILLVGPRMLYALAREGQLSAVFARVHRSYRTPHISIAVFAILAWALAMYSNLAELAALSGIVRLSYYVSTCLAVPVLRRTMPQSEINHRFSLPGGSLVPALGVLVCLGLLAGSSKNQAIVGAITLLLGAMVYLSHAVFRSVGLGQVSGPGGTARTGK